MDEFSKDDLKRIESDLKKNIPKFFITIAGAFAFGAFLMFIPAEFFGRRARRAGVSGNMLENLGLVQSLIFVSIVVIAIILAANWVLQIVNLRKDIEEKKKIVTTVKVLRIENLYPLDKSTNEIIKLGDDTATDIIHFWSNEFNINKYPFNRIANPELLNVIEMYLEISKHSKTEFVRKNVLQQRV